MFLLTQPTYWVRIYMSGPINEAKQVLRRLCLDGECVTIEPASFLYMMGEEEGFVVGFVNYPRFPRASNVITMRAREWMHTLLTELHQGSALLMTPETTEWISQIPR